MVTRTEKTHPVTADEVRAIIAPLVLERRALVRAKDVDAAKAIERAIDYWESRLARARDAASGGAADDL